MEKVSSKETGSSQLFPGKEIIAIAIGIAIGIGKYYHQFISPRLDPDPDSD